MIWVDYAIGLSASATFLSLALTAGTKLAGRSIKRAVATAVEDQLTPALKTVNERFDANDIATKAAYKTASDVQLELARQFGGNSGGIRQAINELSVTVGHVQGAFDQHVKEHKGS